MWLYHRVMSPNDADGMANSVDPDQTAVCSWSALFALAYLSENLGSLWYVQENNIYLKCCKHDITYILTMTFFMSQISPDTKHVTKSRNLGSLGPRPDTLYVFFSSELQHDKTNKMSVRPAKIQISLGIRPV